MDSAIFNPLPMGVYSGMMPCAISQHTNATLSERVHDLLLSLRTLGDAYEEIPQ